MPVTTKDIARETGLSHSTVSRVLNAVPGQRIAEETRKRVFEVARRLEYQPNALARSLKGGRTNIVGFYGGFSAVDVQRDFDGAIVAGLLEAAAPHGIDILLQSHRAHHLEEDIFNKLLDGRLDGLFVFALPSNELVQRLARSNLKAVAIAEYTPDLPSVVCDDSDGIRQLLDYLWAKGHQRIGFIATNSPFVSVERRQKSFEEYMSTRGVPPEQRPVWTSDWNIDLTLKNWRETPEKDRPTAICCWNDEVAYRVLNACLKAGVQVPDDLAITGFDGFLDTKIPARHLVTVQCPWTEVSFEAMKNLVKLLQGEEVSHETRLPVKIVPGDTA